MSEAEPFLEQYAKRSPENQALIGCAGELVRTEDFLAIVEGGRDEDGDFETDKVLEPSSPTPDAVQKKEGLIVFFPGTGANILISNLLYVCVYMRIVSLN